MSRGRAVLPAGRVVTVECPYSGCGESFETECNELHDYYTTVSCWSCGATIAVKFRVSVEASPLKIEGEQGRMTGRLDGFEAAARKGS